MIKRFIIVTSLILLGIVVALNAQELRLSASHSSNTGLNCSFCHECLQPSKQEPCLKLNPKMLIGEGRKLFTNELPPDTLLIDYLEDKYGLVKFPHKQHVHMAEKSTFCVDCHHFLSPGMQKQKCGECHKEDVPWKEDLAMISLSAAYHRKCLTCHVEWSKTTNCEVCHRAKDPRLASESGKIPKFREVKEPEKTVYLTRYFSGPFVYFSHKDHIKRKNVLCVDCHQPSPCIACHYQDEKPKTITAEMKTGVHDPCSLCHQTINTTTCNECHKTIEHQKRLTENK